MNICSTMTREKRNAPINDPHSEKKKKKKKEDDSTVCKEEPAGEEQDHDPHLAQGLLCRDRVVQDGGPILGREDLVDAQEGREYLAKVHRLAALHIPAEDLHREKRGEVVDDHEEEHHVHQTVHVAEHGHQQWAHAWYHEDDAIESRELEDRQPRVRRGVVHGRDLDDRRADGEHEVEVVVALDEEAAPVGQVRDEADHDLDVERDREHQLTDVDDLRVGRTHIHL